MDRLSGVVATMSMPRHLDECGEPVCRAEMCDEVVCSCEMDHNALTSRTIQAIPPSTSIDGTSNNLANAATMLCLSHMLLGQESLCKIWNCTPSPGREKCAPAASEASQFVIPQNLARAADGDSELSQ